MAGLIARIRHRVGYVWYWRVKHWLLDTREGRQARIGALVLVLALAVAQGVHVAIERLRPHPTMQPQQAIIWFVVWLIVALLVGVAVALSMHTNAPPAPDQKAQGPTTQDGKSAHRYYGTFCCTDPAELGWKVMGRDPIQQKGGK